MNHLNALSTNRALAHTRNTASALLEERFSFQSYSEDHEDLDETPVAYGCSTRRAMLDKRLLEDLYEKIALEQALETRDLVLSAHNGVVTIEGAVSGSIMRARIGNFVRRHPFVKDVLNRLRTRDASTAAAPDWRSGSLPFRTQWSAAA